MLPKIITSLILASTTLAAPALAMNAEEGYRWNGPYIGAHGSYSDGTNRDVNNTGAHQIDIDGWKAGIQAGYNYQVGKNFVLGIEGDVSFGKNDDKWTDLDYKPWGGYHGHDKVGTSGTLRARAGLANRHVLVYIAGGLAVADTKHGFGCDPHQSLNAQGNCRPGLPNNEFYTRKSKTRAGYTMGAGIEYALSEKISIKGEYNYIDYGKTNTTMLDPVWPNYHGVRRFDMSTNEFKVGVNYSF